MARQTPTQAQRDQVFDDFDTFQLPLDASLNLGNFTAYGATDPAVDLSMVNIAHLNTTRNFRGTWAANPMDLGQLVQYTPGQVVIGSDNHLYILRDAGDPTIDPAVDNGTNWTTLSIALEAPVTELTSSPPSATANMFTQAGEPLQFQVAPSANATLLNPEVNVTAVGLIGTVPTAAITDDGAVTITAPSGQTNNARITITVDSRSQSMENGELVTHEGGQIDIPIVYLDARTSPLVSEPENARVSTIDPEDTIQFDVTLVPGMTSVVSGTAYDSSWTVSTNGGTATAPSTAGMFLSGPALTDRTFTFAFPLNDNPVGGQSGSPPNISRTVTAYAPWFATFSATPPTGVSDFGVPITLVGETKTNAFPTHGGARFSVTGGVGTTQFFWIAVPSSVNRTISIHNGIATSTGLNTGQTFTVPNALGNGTVEYTLHRFRFGLVQSPTIFTISSIAN